MKFRQRRSEEPEINLIPFIDVLLVVLIFLMMSTTYSKFTELQKIDLDKLKLVAVVVGTATPMAMVMSISVVSPREDLKLRSASSK